jgi:hypothetical protein
MGLGKELGRVLGVGQDKGLGKGLGYGLWGWLADGKAPRFCPQLGQTEEFSGIFCWQLKQIGIFNKISRIFC